MFVLPKFRINLKPLLPKGLEVDTKKVLQSAQRELLKAIRDEIKGQNAFSPRAKRALTQGVGTKLGVSSVQIVAKHPAFFPLVQGQKREQMKWLTKARRPIPIVLDNGELIFRNATPRSMARGRWYHPGRQSTDLIDTARRKARQIVKGRLTKALQKQLREMMARAR